MTGNTYEIKTHGDLDGSNLSSKGKALVLAHLEANPDTSLCRMEPWILDEKGFTPLENSKTIVPVDEIDGETDKAWLVHSGDCMEWVPKSCAELYRASESGVDTQSAPQQGLDSFGVDL